MIYNQKQYPSVRQALKAKRLAKDTGPSIRPTKVAKRDA